MGGLQVDLKFYELMLMLMLQFCQLGSKICGKALALENSMRGNFADAKLVDRVHRSRAFGE